MRTLNHAEFQQRTTAQRVRLLRSEVLYHDSAGSAQVETDRCEWLISGLIKQKAAQKPAGLQKLKRTLGYVP